ncbi:MAG: hypothetical protein DRJ51_04505 [Thermoprotei archaeon]|nr:MAG: hypothetical protein DRJ51_04505 [Thermoprotei archaeon]
MVTQSFLRAYDIRGVIGDELRLEDFLDFGRAVGTVAQGIVIVGRDARIHGEICERAFVSGVLEMGTDVSALGITPIGMLSYAVEALNGDIGVMVGASHNPPEYNGLKFLGRRGKYSKELDARIRKVFLEKNFKNVDWQNIGRLKRVDIRDEYVDFVASKASPERSVSLAVDCKNGAVGVVLREILDRLGCNYIIINEEPNGLFPAGVPEPKPENLKDLMRIVREKGFDLGLAFDGDGDRVVLIDDRGRFVEPEKLAILFMHYLGKRGDKVVASIDSSHILEEEAKKLGIEIVRTRVGHAYVVRAVWELGAIMGLERSGHMTIPSLREFDDGILLAAKIIEVKSKISEKLSAFLDKIPKLYARSLVVKCPDDVKFDVIRKVREELEKKGLNVVTIDGVKVIYDEGWFLIRASNTQPLIRIMVEARTEGGLKELLEYAKCILRKFYKWD